MTAMTPNPAAQREFALKVVEQLRTAGHTALWAGGCVRDQLLGIEPKDYDVATSALPDQIRDLFGRRRTLAIGAAFGVISVLGSRASGAIEVATFRSDGEYLDGRRPATVHFTDAQHDAQRRDFTINGLFYDPVDQRVVDYVGGVADVEARVVRAIGDPHARFAEDKLRLLRAVRFAAAYEFSIDPATLEAMRAMAHQATAVSGERIGAEMRRVLTNAHRRRGVELLADSQLLSALCPELAPFAAPDDPRWQAALDRLAAVETVTLPACLAALFHDLVGEAEARATGRRWRLTNKEVDRTAWLVKHLPDLLRAAESPWPRVQRLLAHDGGAELLALAATMMPDDDPGLAHCRAQLAQGAETWNPAPLVTGDDLIAHGLKAGRHFAQLLDHLRDEQLEGRLATHDEALAEARRWIAEPT